MKKVGGCAPTPTGMAGDSGPVAEYSRSKIEPRCVRVPRGAQSAKKKKSERRLRKRPLLHGCEAAAIGVHRRAGGRAVERRTNAG